ncbi:MAG: prolyl oligopeptidase family serine peptidase [Rickettsiales bacterium]
MAVPDIIEALQDDPFRESDKAETVIVNGHVIPLPYRYLTRSKKLDDGKTPDPEDPIVQWAKIHSEKCFGFTLDGKPMADLMNKWVNHHVIESFKYGRTNLFNLFDDGANHKVLCMREEINGAVSVFLDPKNSDDNPNRSIRNYWPSPDGSLVTVEITENNVEDTTMRVYDVDTKQVIATRNGCRYLNVDYVPRIDGSKGWDVIYLYPVGDDKRRCSKILNVSGRESGEDDGTLFMPTQPNAWSHVYYLPNEKGEPSGYLACIVTVGTTYDYDAYIRLSGGRDWTPVLEQKETALVPLMVKNGRIVAKTTLNAPHGKIVSIDLNNVNRSNWQDLYVGPKNGLIKVCDSYENNIFVILRIHDGEHDGDKVQVYDVNTDSVIDVTGIPDFCNVEIVVPSPGTNNPPLFTIGGCRHKPHVYRLSDDMNIQLWNKSQAPYDLGDDFTVKAETVRVHKSQLSMDGIEPEAAKDLFDEKGFLLIPVMLAYHKDTKLDGYAHMIVEFEGKNEAIHEFFASSVTHTFIMNGGIFAQIFMPGGREKGEEWKKLGRGDNKFNQVPICKAVLDYLTDTQQNGTKYASAENICGWGTGFSANTMLLTEITYPGSFGRLILENGRYNMLSCAFAGWEAYYREEAPANPEKALEASALYALPLSVKKGSKIQANLFFLCDFHNGRSPCGNSFVIVKAIEALSPSAQMWMLCTENRGYSLGGADRSQKITLAENRISFAFGDSSSS